MNLRHHKTTIGLVVAAVMLTGVILWDKGRVSTGEADKRTENIIEAWRPDDLSKIEINIGGRSLRMERERDEDDQLVWVLYEGDERLDGDALEMTELASTLELAMFYRKVEDIDEATLGFSEPRAEFVVHMGQLSYTLRIGAEAAQPEGGAYVEVDGGGRGRTVYVVTKPTLEEFLIDPLKLMNKQLTPLLSNAVERYEVDGPKGKLALVRGGWGGWTNAAFKLEAEGMDDVRADRVKVDAWVGAVARIEAKRFVPITKEDPPKSTVIRMKPREDGAPNVHLVVAPESKAGCGASEAYAIRRAPDPVAACIDAGVLKRLEISAAELRDQRVVGTEKAAITELKMEGLGTVVDLARKADGWVMRKPTEGPSEKEPTEQLINALASATGERVEHPDLEALGLDKPRATLRIIGLPERGAAEDAKEREEKIDVGDEVDGKVHVRRRDDGVVLALPVEVGQKFLPQPTLLRSNVIFSEEKKYIRGIDVDCGGRRQKLARGLDVAWTWEFPKDVEADVDPLLANNLMDDVRELTAVRWDAETVQERHGLAKPWCRIEVSIVEPDPADVSGDTKINRKLIVSLGNETRGGYFARVGNEDAVFVAPRVVGTSASVWMIQRTKIRVPTTEVDTVTLESGDKRLVVRKQGDTWTAEDGANTTAVKVGTALEGLIADVVDHRGPARDGEGFDSPTLKMVVTFRGKPDEKVTFLVGDGTRFRNAPAFRVRRSDVNLTFVVSDAKIRPFLDAL